MGNTKPEVKIETLEAALVKIAELKDSLEKVSRVSGEKSAEILQLKADLEAMQNTANELTTSISNLTTENDDLKASMETLEKEAETQVAELTAQLDSKKVTVSAKPVVEFKGKKYTFKYPRFIIQRKTFLMTEIAKDPEAYKDHMEIMIKRGMLIEFEEK